MTSGGLHEHLSVSVHDPAARVRHAGVGKRRERRNGLREVVGGQRIVVGQIREEFRLRDIQQGLHVADMADVLVVPPVHDPRIRERCDHFRRVVVRGVVGDDEHEVEERLPQRRLNRVS